MTITTFEVLKLIGQMLIFMVCLAAMSRLRVFVIDKVTYFFGKRTYWNLLHLLTGVLDFSLLLLFMYILDIDGMHPDKATIYSAVVSAVFLMTAATLYDFMWNDKQDTKLAKFLDAFHLRVVRW